MLMSKLATWHDCTGKIQSQCMTKCMVCFQGIWDTREVWWPTLCILQQRLSDTVSGINSKVLFKWLVALPTQMISHLCKSLTAIFTFMSCQPTIINKQLEINRYHLLNAILHDQRQWQYDNTKQSSRYTNTHALSHCNLCTVTCK